MVLSMRKGSRSIAKTRVTAVKVKPRQQIVVKPVVNMPAAKPQAVFYAEFLAISRQLLNDPNMVIAAAVIGFFIISHTFSTAGTGPLVDYCKNKTDNVVCNFVKANWVKIPGFIMAVPLFLELNSQKPQAALATTVGWLICIFLAKQLSAYIYAYFLFFVYFMIRSKSMETKIICFLSLFAVYALMPLGTFF